MWYWFKQGLLLLVLAGSAIFFAPNTALSQSPYASNDGPIRFSITNVLFTPTVTRIMVAFSAPGLTKDICFSKGIYVQMNDKKQRKYFLQNVEGIDICPATTQVSDHGEFVLFFPRIKKGTEFSLVNNSSDFHFLFKNVPIHGTPPQAEPVPQTPISSSVRGNGLRHSDLLVKDYNDNGSLEPGEQSEIVFTLYNRTKQDISNVTLMVRETAGVTGIDFAPKHSLGPIRAGTSKYVRIPVKGEESLAVGDAHFIISSDSKEGIRSEDMAINYPCRGLGTGNTSTLSSEVDLIIPKSNHQQPNAVAVVIGNRDYKSTKKVDYAINDARSFRSYLEASFGIDPANIIYLENASKGDLTTVFGIKGNHMGKLASFVQEQVSDVVIFYSGHGAPGLNDKQGYLVPVECEPNYVEVGGYSLQLLMHNLSLINAKSITVITDACFSGADIYEGISPIGIRVEKESAIEERVVWLSSSTGTQVSAWHGESQHGLFTFHLLRAIQDFKETDLNNDGRLSVEEVYKAVSHPNKGVPYAARRKGIQQTPRLQGRNRSLILTDFN